MKVLIATHGTYAQGIQSAASIILGNLDGVDVINAYVDDKSLKDKINEYLEDKNGEEVLVLTDMFGGSVNQALIPYIQTNSINLVTGVNLPCVLEILSKRDFIDTTIIEEIVEESRKQIMFVNEILKNVDSGDDFDWGEWDDTKIENWWSFITRTGSF